MALGLILRSTNKMQGYPCILRCTTFAFTNASNPGYVSNRELVSTNHKITPSVFNTNVLIKPSVRCMSAGGDHRMMWTIERILSMALLGLLPVTIAMPNPVFDNATAIAMVLHFHWGIEAMVEDYVRPIIFGNVIPKVSLMAVYIISGVTLGGLLFFNYTDIGLGKAIRRIWSIKA